MEREQILVHMTPHETVIAALTMEAVVDIHDRSGGPVYEPLVFARVCDIAAEYGYVVDVTPMEFLKMLKLLELAHHVHRRRMMEPRVGGMAPHVVPTESGRLDAMGARPLLRRVLHNGV